MSRHWFSKEGRATSVFSVLSSTTEQTGMRWPSLVAAVRRLLKINSLSLWISGICLTSATAVKLVRRVVKTESRAPSVAHLM
jgi:hypothetical protein